MVLERDEYFLHGVGFHPYHCLNLLLAELETQLLQHLDVQCVPIVGLLRD